MIHCEVITKQDEILQYREAWNNLFESGEHEVSTSFEWTYALLTTHLNENDLFLLMIFKDAEEIVGLVPLIISKTKKYGQSIKTLFPISEYYNTHSDILLKDKSEQLIEAFVNYLCEINYKWDMFRIGRFVETNPIIEHIKIYLKNKFLEPILNTCLHFKKVKRTLYLKLKIILSLYW